MTPDDDKLKKKKDELIYDLIFSKQLEYEIVVTDYILDIYTYYKFINSIKEVLAKSKVVIVSEKVKASPTVVLWKIKVKK